MRPTTSGSPVRSQIGIPVSDSELKTTAIYSPRSDREWRRQYGPAIGAAVVQMICHAGLAPRMLGLTVRALSFRFDRANHVFQYWRTKLEEACVGCFASQCPVGTTVDG